MPFVTGRLTDLTSLPLDHKEPEIIFTLNGANSAGGNLYPTYPVVVRPDAAGLFRASLAPTEDMVDTGWYNLQIRLLGPTPDARTIVDFPDWRISVPREGGSITKLISQRGNNPEMVWESTDPPIAPRPNMKWLDPSTGRLYRFRGGAWRESAGRGDWQLIRDLTGPAGYNALGTEPQQQTVASWLAGTSGANPVQEAGKALVNNTAVNSQTFMPTANITYKYNAAKGYRYEVIRVRCNGKFRPGILHKVYAYDFEKNGNTGDNFKAPDGVGEPLQSIVARTGADVAFNCSGWDTLDRPTKYMLRGLQIKNGVMYRDFETFQRGLHCIGVRADGTMAGYKVEDGWTGAQVLADGVIHTFGFGPLLVHNGIAQDIESLTDFTSLTTPGVKSGRQVLGHTVDGDILLISVVGVSADNTGTGGSDLVALAHSEGCHNAIMLDGGGSVQTVYDGYTTHPSSDSAALRPAGDAGLIYARITQSPDSTRLQGVEPLVLDPAVAAKVSDVYSPGAVVRSGTVSLQGAIAPAGGGQFPAGQWIVVGSVPDKARPKNPVGSGTFSTVATSTRNAPAQVQIRAYGQMSINLSAPADSVFLDNVTYPAF